MQASTNTFEVEKLLDVRDIKRGRRPVREYLVAWKGYALSDATWEPEGNLHCPETMKAFWARRERTRAGTRDSPYTAARSRRSRRPLRR